ncbi:MAG: M48 family metallopeptidase [Desulfobacterales bacterium]|nr:M48 family metallopeptidase [Desulfobacterales bacterium]
MKRLLWVAAICFLVSAGCEDIDLRLATEAGIDVVKAITLSDKEVMQLAEKAAVQIDQKNQIAPPESKYTKRLNRLVGEHRQEDGYTFEYKVYLSPTVNAFALGNGSIRIYSGLMDMMDDSELRFVIGHEMGHVVEKHIKKKMELALASSALRKGIASQQNIVGDLARSALGSFINAFLNAQFSQEEEKAADAYALKFMKREGYDQKGAISALEKLATLGSNHTFLSSHPAPGKRAERMKMGIHSPEKLAEKGLMEKAWSILQSIIKWAIEIVGKIISYFI